jgi:DnaJ-domain-containing protein 1
MISDERLEEMRSNELRVIQRNFQHEGVKKISEELADALAELIGRRKAEQAEEERIFRKAVEEEGADHKNVAMRLLESAGIRLGLR